MTTPEAYDPARLELSHHLRALYAEAAEHIQHLFKSDEEWVGSSIDYVALRLIHEKYPHLTPDEVRSLVTVISDRLQHGAKRHSLTALYP